MNITSETLCSFGILDVGQNQKVGDANYNIPSTESFDLSSLIGCLIISLVRLKLISYLFMEDLFRPEFLAFSQIQ
jgi:hypothetical protein